MALNSARVTVSTSATLLDSTVGEAAQSVALQADSGNSLPVFVGGSAVAVADGWELAPGAVLAIPYDAAASGIYGIVAAGTETVQVLEVESARGY